MFSESDGYERFMGRWSRRLAPLFVDFAGVEAGNDVLDVGCGTGALTFAAAAVPAVRAVGVDPSSEFVRAAQQAGDGDRVRFQVGDASALPFPDAAVRPDAVAAGAELCARRHRGGARDDPGDPTQRRCGRSGLGLRRRHGDAPRVLGRGGRARSGRGRARRTPHAVESPRRVVGVVARPWAAQRRGRAADVRHGVRIVRRLLAALPLRAGTGRRLRVHAGRTRPARAAGEVARPLGERRLGLSR